MEQNNSSINVKEFRIGNLVYNPFLFCIHEVSETTLSGSQITRYERIPLTEKWLLKFGFTKDGNLFFHPVHSYIQQDAYGCNGGFGYCLNDEKVIFKELKYVHTLQNFCFAMADKELTIK